MDVQINVDKRLVTCVCLKNIDLYSEKNIRETILHNLPHPRNYDDFVFDISNVAYIDSTGIGMLIFYFNYMSKKGKSFTLKGVQESIFNILVRNKINKLFTITE